MVSFRPLFGVSLFLLYGFHHEAHSNMFSSPLRGISISTDINMCMGNWKHCFRPLYGVSLFLLSMIFIISPYQSVFVPSSGYLYFYTPKRFTWNEKSEHLVFVPSTGYLYFYENRWLLYQITISFRPLYGVSLFLLLLALMICFLAMMFSSPLRGISISTIWISSRSTFQYVFVPSSGYLYFYWH